MVSGSKTIIHAIPFNWITETAWAKQKLRELCRYVYFESTQFMRLEKVYTAVTLCNFRFNNFTKNT